MSELTEWVIIIGLVTIAGMFVLSMGFVLVFFYSIYKKLRSVNE